MAGQSVSVEVEAQAPEQPPKDLDAFVGNWAVQGRNGPGAERSADMAVTGEESYEWLSGGFFLVYRWNRHFGDTTHTGIGITGRDTAGDGYAAHFFDNLGYARKYEADVRDRVLTLTGKWERATIAVSDDGNTMSIHWERSTDGAQWVTLCDLTGSKLSPSVPLR